MTADLRAPEDSQSPGPRGQHVEDDGLRRMLIYTFIALVVSLVMAFIAVGLAIRYFDRP
jgi:hypothetical protein